MASTVLEATRAAHEDLERLERLAVRELQREPANPRNRLFQSHRVRHMLDLVVSTSDKLVEIYEDKDNARKDEINTHLTAPTQNELFSKYYERLKEEQVFTENDGFFTWMFLKRRTLWQTIFSFVWPLFALAVCFFPVYPYQCKIVVLYSCAAALLFIVSILLLRAAIFGILWVLLGKRVWFFPNINAEETTFRELVRFWPKKDEGERPKWTSRLFYALVALLVILLLRHHAPDEAARARYQKKVSNIIDDVLEWSPKLAISGMIEKHIGANITEESNYTSRAASSHVPSSTKDKASEADPDMDADGDARGILSLRRSMRMVGRWPTYISREPSLL